MMTTLSPEKYLKEVDERVEVFLPEIISEIQDRINELMEQGDFPSYSAVRHALKQLDDTRKFLNRS